MTIIEKLRDKANSLPLAPGVYIMLIFLRHWQPAELLLPDIALDRKMGKVPSGPRGSLYYFVL